MKIQILIQKHVHCPHEAGAENFQQPGMWQVLPIRVRVKPHIFSTLFCEFVIILLQSFSTVATTSQLLAAPLRSQLFNSSHNSSQLFSTILTFAYLCAHLLNPFQLLSTFLSLTLLTSSHLFSTLLATSHLFSTLVDNVHLCPPHINSCQLAELFSPLLNSCENRHLCWTHFNCQMFQLKLLSFFINPCDLFNLRLLYFLATQVNQFRLFSALLTSFSTMRNSPVFFSKRNLVAKRNKTTRSGSKNCSSKTGFWRQSERNRCWGAV